MMHRLTRRPLPALSAAIAVLVIACGANPPRPTASAGPSAATPTGSPAASAASPSVPASPSAPSSTGGVAAWTELHLPGDVKLGEVSDVTRFGGGLLAVGRAFGGPQAPTALVSPPDGSWTIEPIPSAGGRAPTRVMPWGDRVLAVGVGDAPCAHPQGDGMWVRAAGGTWTEAPFDQLFCTGGTFDVAATAARAVIAGTSTGETAYVWASEDGIRWTDRSQPFEGFAPQAVTAVGDGFVAFGVGSTGVWVSVSSDGSSWGSPQVTVPLTDTSVVAAVTLDGRPLAIIKTTQGQVGLLELADGAWTSRAATGLDANGLVRVVAAGAGLVALGDQAGGAGAWVSADGVAWRAIELPDRLHATGANVAGAAIDGKRAAIVGNLPLPDGTSTGSIWTGPSSLLAP